MALGVFVDLFGRLGFFLAAALLFGLVFLLFGLFRRFFLAPFERFFESQLFSLRLFALLFLPIVKHGRTVDESFLLLPRIFAKLTHY